MLVKEELATSGQNYNKWKTRKDKQGNSFFTRASKDAQAHSNLEYRTNLRFLAYAHMSFFLFSSSPSSWNLIH